VTPTTLDVLVLDGRYAASDPDAVWATLGWRAAAVAVGVALDVLCSTLILPVTVDGHLRDRCAAALAALAAFSEAAVAWLAAPGGPDARALTALAARAGGVRARLAPLAPLDAQAGGELLPALGARRLDPARVRQLLHRLRAMTGHWLLAAAACALRSSAPKILYKNAKITIY
jgi:hypothetical protein